MTANKYIFITRSFGTFGGVVPIYDDTQQINLSITMALYVAKFLNSNYEYITCFSSTKNSKLSSHERKSECSCI